MNVRIKVDIQGVQEFVIEITIPEGRDMEEYVDEFLDGILNDDMRYNCDWEEE